MLHHKKVIGISSKDVLMLNLCKVVLLSKMRIPIGPKVPFVCNLYNTYCFKRLNLCSSYVEKRNPRKQTKKTFYQPVQTFASVPFII